VWNVVVFQLMVYKWPEAIDLLIIAVFAIVTFTGVEFVHPVRVVRWRPLTLAMCGAWAVLGLVALFYNLAPPTWVVVLFALVNAYFTVIGVFLQVTRPKIAS
jgi:phosphatidylcholine synthase